METESRGKDSLAPLRTMVHAAPISTPEKWISLSSPIMISSISLQLPSLVFPGFSKVDAISPPASTKTFKCRSHNGLSPLNDGNGVCTSCHVVQVFQPCSNDMSLYNPPPV